MLPVIVAEGLPRARAGGTDRHREKIPAFVLLKSWLWVAPPMTPMVLHNAGYSQRLVRDRNSSVARITSTGDGERRGCHPGV
jgi:hypothetical protein